MNFNKCFCIHLFFHFGIIYYVYMKKSQKFYLFIKRIIGIFGSFIGILVCFPLIYWWVFIVNLFATKGHPLFTQERVGRNGKTFKLIKFRSMKYGSNPNITSAEQDRYQFTTGFGRFLRKSSLDETPQLFNIFVGQMAFIGPRPLIDVGDDHITNELRKQNGSITLRPGISGHAQTHGRIDVSAEEKAELDKYYLDHISLWLDIKIFVLHLIDIIIYKILINNLFLFHALDTDNCMLKQLKNAYNKKCLITLQNLMKINNNNSLASSGGQIIFDHSKK